MPLQIDFKLSPRQLAPKLERLFEISAKKILALEKNWRPNAGAPVFTQRGRYTARGWTEWTEGFQYGSALLQFDVTHEPQFLELGRARTRERMATHLSHVGVHDHGFNNISTYGNLHRLVREEKIAAAPWELDFYEIALKVSGAIQAARWTRLSPNNGFIHSFNGPHSLFVDTLRSLRSLALAHQLGHRLMAEQDEKVSLLDRLIQHAQTTARYSIFYGDDRDAYDVRGRTAHEIIFNPRNGAYRCPNSQQGYSPFSTWTRGLAWAICGFAEQLEFMETVPSPELTRFGGRQQLRRWMLKAAAATSDYYLNHCCTDGVPPWDTGAPNLHRLPDYLTRPSNPYNDWEPVDSSAAAVAAIGLLRLGNFLRGQGDQRHGRRYRQAAISIAHTLLSDPYLSVKPQHQGLLLHSIYHRPNGWDYIAPGQKIPNGESSMWGDYHLRELGLLLWREAKEEPYPTFFVPPDYPTRPSR